MEYNAVDEQVPQLWNEVKPKVTSEIFIIIRRYFFSARRGLTSNMVRILDNLMNKRM